MAFRRSGNSRGRSYSFGSRFRKPVARAKFMWVNQLTTLSDVTTSGNNRLAIGLSSLWQTNAASGNMEMAYLERLLWLPTIGGNATTLTQQVPYALYIDDTDASSPGDPATVTFYDAAQPFHLGLLNVRQATTGTVTTDVFPPYAGYADSWRQMKLHRKWRVDESLWMQVSQVTASAGTASLTVLARMLIRMS